LDGWRSPKPSKYPTIDIVANERVYVVRRSSQTSDERDLSHNTLAKSFPGVFSNACSKTSTCEERDRDCVRDVSNGQRRKRRRGKKKEKRNRAKKNAAEKKTKNRPRIRVSSLSPLDVQSALTDAAAVSHSDSVDVCGRITAKVFDARVSALAARETNRRGGFSLKKKDVPC
jgi:hypothetical protein